MHACAEILELQHISGLKYVIVIQFIYIYIYIYIYILFLWRNPLKSLKGLGHWSC